MAEEFGKKLKELREAKRFTQQQIATSLGITTRQVQRYEEGSIPRPEKIRGLNKIFKFDFFSLLGDTKSHIEESQIQEHESGPMKIISDLTESVKSLAESNKILAKNNEVLVIMVSSGVPVGVSSSSPAKDIVSKDPVEDMQPDTQGKNSTEKRKRKKDSVTG